MSWPEAGDDRWEDPDGDPDESVLVHWPLQWRGLYPRERWIWFDQLWSEVCALWERYHLAIRSGWWENEVQLEALAALSAWVSRYDSGEWDDPPGKLALLYDLERVATLLREGVDPFNPRRDRAAFEQHLIGIGCQPPPPDVDSAEFREPPVEAEWREPPDHADPREPPPPTPNGHAPQA